MALRNRIISLVVVKNFYGNPIIFNRETGPYFPESKDEHLQPSLSQVCRQLRDEVLPIYGENLFGVHIHRNSHVVEQDRPAFRRWLDTVGEKYVDRFVHFRFDVQVCGAAVQLHLLSEPRGYHVRRIAAKTEDRKAKVKKRVEALLEPVNERRVGGGVCVEDIRGLEEKLQKMSKSRS